MMRKTVCILMALFFPVLLIITGFAKADEMPVSLQSKSAVLMDAGTGQILAQINANEPYVAASAIKVMTMLLVFEALNEGYFSMQETIYVSQNAASKGGTQAFLEPGDEYKAEELVRAMCMASANDATVALAEKIYGSEELFVTKMNERAKELGCVNTSFDNCTGLDSDTTTTAVDLALIASALSEQPLVFSYTSSYMYTLVHSTGRETELVNPNKLVRFYANCDGLATGSSGSSMYAGVFTAKRGNMRLIVVTMCASDSQARSEDAKTLFNYGFANYSSRTIVRKGEILYKDYYIPGGRPDHVDIVCPQDVTIVVSRGDEKLIRQELVLMENIEAPIEALQQIGTFRVYFGEEVLLEIPAVAAGESCLFSMKELILLMIRCWLSG